MQDHAAAEAKASDPRVNGQLTDQPASGVLEELLALPPDELARVLALMSAEERRVLEGDLAELERRRRMDRLGYYAPYPKQREFHAAGAHYRERLFMAGNQLGKTWAGGAEIAMHLTGRYPAWWDGRRFDRPTVGYVGNDTAELVRDGPQRVLFGRLDAGELGTGMVPAAAIRDTVAARGTPNAFDTVQIAHASGGLSLVKFKTYKAGRQAWASETLDWVWFDEEPPIEVYSEGITRTAVVMGPILITFTPLLGMSQVVAKFLRAEDKHLRHKTQMGIDDVPMTPEERAGRIAQYRPHERKARLNGEPMLGSGAIFPIEESRIAIARFPVPAYWPALGGLDFGIDHPFAAVKLALDPVTKGVFVTQAYRVSDESAAVHVVALKAFGEDLKWAWPHDGKQRDKGSGIQLASQYRKLGLKMLPLHATFEDGSNGVEAGLLQMFTAMETGLFRCFDDLGEWLEEFRTYHRKEGKIVREGDDLMSATRYAWMMRRLARPSLAAGPDTRPPRADAGDYDPLRW